MHCINSCIMLQCAVAPVLKANSGFILVQYQRLCLYIVPSLIAASLQGIAMRAICAVPNTGDEGICR